MFLGQTIKRNQKLMEAAFALHQSGQILPDSYLIDVDTFLENAEKIREKAEEYQVRLYFMLKQLGRNPWLAKELVRLGYHGAVAVDYREARVMMEHGIPIGNVGHLVQIPGSMVREVVAARPEVITVYSREKILEIQKAAGELNVRQGIMIRVYGDGDMIYSGQTAGFHLEELKDTAEWIKESCPNLDIRGITSFPCYLYQEDKGEILPTPNLDTVLKGKELLENLGFRLEIINTPSATCCYTLEQISRQGGNCGEPGHGLTGTTPMHASHELEEIPAAVYVSEVSHSFMGNSYCFGGGHYRRSHVASALCGSSFETARRLEVIPPTDESIDYHFGLSGEAQIGETVVMAFRFQIFVTRSDVVLVKGIQSGKPEIIGIYDSQGRKKEQP